MTLQYECDRCKYLTSAEIYEMRDKNDHILHLCDDCYDLRQSIDERFMRNVEFTFTPTERRD